MIRYILWVYMGMSLVNIIATGFSFISLNQLTKPFIIPLLMLYVYLSSLGRTTLRILFLFIALLFSWLGELIFIYQSIKNYSIIGIGLLLIAQLIYISALKRSMYQSSPFNLINSLPFLIYTGTLIYISFPIKDFTVLMATIYGSTITIMVITSKSREGHTSNESYKSVFAGSILFLLSGSLLILNSFHNSIPYAETFITLTYCGAQLLLVIGVLKHVE